MDLEIISAKLSGFPYTEVPFFKVTFVIHGHKLPINKTATYLVMISK